jgi:hypothetical protein
VQGFPLDSRRARVAFLTGIPDSVGPAGGEEDPGPPGHLPGDPLNDEGVGPEREMGSVLDEGPHGQDQPGIPGQNSPYLGPREAIEGP